MRNTLYTFGCSVTENLDNLPNESERVIYATKYCGGKYECWPEILSNKLKYNIDNYAAANAWGKFDFNLGNSNEDILEALFIKSNDFYKDDIVIVQFTSLARFRYASHYNTFRTIIPNHVDEFSQQTTLIDMLENKSNPLWIRPLFNSVIPIIKLSEEIGFKLYFWSNCDIIQNYQFSNKLNNWLFDENINDLLPKIGANQIAEVTDYNIVDYHLAQPGQKILADLIYSKIK